jgi:hypothetical protein
MGREVPGDSQPPIISGWGGTWVVTRLGVYNLYTFATEKKAQRKRNVQLEMQY